MSMLFAGGDYIVTVALVRQLRLAEHQSAASRQPRSATTKSQPTAANASHAFATYRATLTHENNRLNSWLGNMLVYSAVFLLKYLKLHSLVTTYSAASGPPTLKMAANLLDGEQTFRRDLAY